MKKIIFIFLFLFFYSANLLSDQGNHPISNGSRINLKEKNFSITPPNGWEIITNEPHVSLLLQIPKQKEVYQRNIEIIKQGGPRVINEDTAKKFKEIIIKNLERAQGIENPSVRNFQILDLKDKSQGILFYVDFMLQDIAMMQANVLVSSEQHHFMIIFTDKKENFEGPLAESTFNLAWNSILSIELESKAPSSSDTSSIIYVVIFFLLVGFLILFAIRKKNLKPSYLAHDDEDDPLSDGIHNTNFDDDEAVDLKDQVDISQDSEDDDLEKDNYTSNSKIDDDDESKEDAGNSNSKIDDDEEDLISKKW